MKKVKNIFKIQNIKNIFKRENIIKTLKLKEKKNYKGIPL